jgi:hypothetical protein
MCIDEGFDIAVDGAVGRRRRNMGTAHPTPTDADQGGGDTEDDRLDARRRHDRRDRKRVRLSIHCRWTGAVTVRRLRAHDHERQRSHPIHDRRISS